MQSQITVVQQSLPFDQRSVFDRLPLSEDQKLVLLTRLVSERKEIADQSNIATQGNVRTGGACAAEETPPPVEIAASHPA